MEWQRLMRDWMFLDFKKSVYKFQKCYDRRSFFGSIFYAYSRENEIYTSLVLDFELESGLSYLLHRESNKNLYVEDHEFFSKKKGMSFYQCENLYNSQIYKYDKEVDGRKIVLTATKGVRELIVAIYGDGKKDNFWRVKYKALELGCKCAVAIN